MISVRPGNLQSILSLFRIHGSALYRAFVPSLLSTGILIVLDITSDEPTADLAERWIQHPYSIACMMVAFTFLLTFHCNFSYNRYWEACTAIHQMQSKWLDIGMELAAFHLQSAKFGHIRPVAFGQHPHIDHVIRKRERQTSITPMKLEEILNQIENDDDDEENDVISTNQSPKSKNILMSIFTGRRKKKNRDKRRKIRQTFMDSHGECNHDSKSRKYGSINHSSEYKESDSLAAGLYSLSSKSNLPRISSKSTDRPGLTKLSSIPDLTGGMSTRATPSLFLQEASHLISLMSAVAFSTLRNDVETAESPLQNYIPGSPWPPVDPDSEYAGDYSDFYKGNGSMNALRYLFGFVRTPAQRTVYNACRPFKVLGGVSDAEILLLQRARGPLAKTALCTLWLQEFISREYLNGSLGDVPGPIISRLYQYTSDGMIGYNQARKIAYVPFPFPHSQLTTFFLVIVICVMPILMLTFVSQIIVAAILNGMTVGVFFGE